jgi:hypothetical protein
MAKYSHKNKTSFYNLLKMQINNKIINQSQNISNHLEIRITKI